jgi:hypothetical protein
MPNLNITEPKYWLATDNVNVAHFGYAEAGISISTGQPELLTFPTMAALVAALVALNFPIMDGSTYPDKEWYMWPSKATADAALASINSNPAFPALIPDPATGERTVSVAGWCSAARATTDGLWGFPRIPTRLLDEWKISAESREAWLAAFQPAIVTDPTLLV